MHAKIGKMLMNVQVIECQQSLMLPKALRKLLK